MWACSPGGLHGAAKACSYLLPARPVQGGPMLPWVLGAWSTALLAGGLGLMKGGAKAVATV